MAMTKTTACKLPAIDEELGPPVGLLLSYCISNDQGQTGGMTPKVSKGCCRQSGKALVHCNRLTRHQIAHKLSCTRCCPAGAKTQKICLYDLCKALTADKDRLISLGQLQMLTKTITRVARGNVKRNHGLYADDERMEWAWSKDRQLRQSERVCRKAVVLLHACNDQRMMTMVGCLHVQQDPRLEIRLQYSPH